MPKDGPKKLGNNRQGYVGESIDITAVISECLKEAKKARFEIETLPIESLEIIALTKCRKRANRRIYISAGIHGDEPAGPLALLELIKDNDWPRDADLYIFPCLNPTGFLSATRLNHTSHDLNRDYLHKKTPEIKAHTEWLEAQSGFDLTLCLHEDWGSEGFYLYETRLCHHNSIAKKIIDTVAKVFPIDRSKKIDGYHAKDGVIGAFCESQTFSEWPEAIYLCHKKNSLNYTLETSSDYLLKDRVKAMVKAIRVAIG